MSYKTYMTVRAIGQAIQDKTGISEQVAYTKKRLRKNPEWMKKIRIVVTAQTERWQVPNAIAKAYIAERVAERMQTPEAPEEAQVRAPITEHSNAADNTTVLDAINVMATLVATNNNLIRQLIDGVARLDAMWAAVEDDNK